MQAYRSWQDQIAINRNSIRPLYLQVKEALEEWIVDGLASGTLTPGDRLPSENELSEQLGVSNITVKRSLDELRRQGLIQRIQGRGSFVGQPKMILPLQRLFSLTTVTRTYGMLPSRKVLELHEMPATGSVARRLGIPEKNRVIRLVRLRLMDRMPIAVDTSYLPLEFFPDLMTEYKEQNSLYETLVQRYQCEIVRTEDLLSPVLINPFESKALEVPVGSLGILIERNGFGPKNERLEFTKSVFRGDLCSFSLQFHKDSE